MPRANRSLAFQAVSIRGFHYFRNISHFTEYRFLSLGNDTIFLADVLSHRLKVRGDTPAFFANLLLYIDLYIFLMFKGYYFCEAVKLLILTFVYIGYI